MVKEVVVVIIYGTTQVRLEGHTKTKKNHTQDIRSILKGSEDGT
jgi:hypothetical protein